MKKVLKYFLFTTIALVILGGVLFVIFARGLPNPENLSARQFAQSTKILDRNGSNVLYDVHGDIKRTIIPLKEIPTHTVEATIAIEDNDFYNHPGIDIAGILRAAWINIRGAEITQGGSTITQQFIKNALLTPERTFTRKIRELFLALELERRYSKEEILSFYFNQIPYGSNIYGIEAASQSFFGKSASDLTLAESSYLAALPKAPTFYSPYGNNPEALEARRNIVLERMLNLDFITEKEKTEAKNIPLKDILKKDDRGITAPHFVIYVRQLLNERFGEDFVERAGLRVYTTLDKNLQEAAEEIVKERALFNEKNFQGKNAALVAIDPRNGEILAMVGSRDYHDIENDGNVNVVTRLNQPGSTFKPFAYAAAFEKGFTPETILFDLKTNFGVQGAKEYIPQNYDFQTRGPVTMRQSLAQSLNIPSVKTLYLAGIDNTIDTAERMGISTLKDRGRFGLSLVLGGGDVTLLELSSAFGAFSQEGILKRPRAILRIEDSSGNVLEEFLPQEKRVLDKTTARTITDILSDNTARIPAFGERNSLVLPDRPVAAKTGTTQKFKDAWTIGYTPQLVAGVWVGNNDNTPMVRAPGASAAAPIWNKFMRQALQEKPVLLFTEPEIKTADKPILSGKFANEVTVEIDSLSGKRATQFTPEELIEERKYRQVHSILYYVDKDNPRGPAPENPDFDPQFERWEEPVARWAQTAGNGFNQSPPSEFDDLHTLQNRPSLQILSPASGEAIEEKINLELSINAPLGTKEADIFINGLFIEKITDFPSVSVALPQNAKGNTLTVKLYDRALNSVLRSQSVNVVQNTAKTFSLSGNRNQLALSAPFSLRSVVIYYKKGSTFSRTKVLKQVFGSSFSWTPPEDNIQVFAIGEDLEGKRWISNTLDF